MKTSLKRAYVEKLGIPGYVVYPEGKIKRFAKDKWGMNSSTFLKGLVLN